MTQLTNQMATKIILSPIAQRLFVLLVIKDRSCQISKMAAIKLSIFWEGNQSCGVISWGVKLSYVS